jgi:hypothetical protein
MLVLNKLVAAYNPNLADQPCPDKAKTYIVKLAITGGFLKLTQLRLQPHQVTLLDKLVGVFLPIQFKESTAWHNT